jgi:CxxC motif-containing protein (DUF1111 family)
MKSRKLGVALLLCMATAAAANAPRLQPHEARPGGATTHALRPSAGSFSSPAANLSLTEEMDFVLGRALFRKLWVSSPSSTTASDGLGPLYNARSCQRCHLNNGRGKPPEGPEDRAVSLFLRLSIPAKSEQEQRLAARVGVVPEPRYGTQLQNFAVAGLAAEGQLELRYTQQRIALSDGETAWLRTPRYRITNLAYGALHPDLQLSPRIAPPMIGLGLLEQIPAADILALADPQDRNRDGISGRPNRVWDRAGQTMTLGRFGWKAGNPSLMQQNGSALQGDIGIGNPVAPAASGDCTGHQRQCMQAPNGNTQAQDGLEASQQILDLLLFYSRHLAPPPRPTAADPDVLAGKQLFNDSGCAACHRPHFITAANPLLPALSQQSIWPYSDLLLHDMGEGLADHRPEFAANGREWRTAPLWGIGLTQTVSGHSNLLHDGRARNLLEAVLWHGGEAAAARQQVIGMPAQQRTQLLRFLESL